MAHFHELTVTDITRLTHDAVVLTLEPDTPEAFAFTQGQYLTFRRAFDGVDLRRCYSICSAPGTGLQVGIKRVDGGVFSTFANAELQVGERLEAMAPMGSFYAPSDGSQVLCVAGGSGITPILSILRAGLSADPHTRFTLVYANRNSGSIMFRSELSDLKDQYLSRFHVIHVLEDGAEDAALLSGILDAQKCAVLFQDLMDMDAVAMGFVCGPGPMMDNVSEGLLTAGLASDRIRIEHFTGQQSGRAPKAAAVRGEVTVEVSARVILGGEARGFAMSEGTSLLDAALAEGLDAPFACRAGICSTCKARVLGGEVQMRTNHALEDYEVEQGYVLTCQSYPVSDKVIWDYDQSGH